MRLRKTGISPSVFRLWEWSQIEEEEEEAEENEKEEAREQKGMFVIWRFRRAVLRKTGFVDEMFCVSIEGAAFCSN